MIYKNNKGQEVTVICQQGRYFKVSTRKGNTFNVRKDKLLSGEFKIKDEPSVCLVGYVGYGKYKTKVSGKRTKYYEVWRGIIRRCYDESCSRYKNYGGKGVKVCEDWLDFQNFAEWYNLCEDYLPNIKGERFFVDKDILGGNVYSPENCLTVPYYLNNLFKGIEVKGYKIGKSHRATIGVLGKNYQIPDLIDSENIDEVLSYYRKEIITEIITCLVANNIVSPKTFTAPIFKSEVDVPARNHVTRCEIIKEDSMKKLRKRVEDWIK